MNWIKKYKLFLFDFDGVLVDSEKVHFKACVELCRRRGYNLDWDFNKYCSVAHSVSNGTKAVLHQNFPELKKIDWNILINEKSAIYTDLISNKIVDLMPGVELFLQFLEKNDLKRCVVTHSLLDHVKILKEQHAVLRSIPHWITREDYSKGKPDPEGFQAAIDRLAEPGDNIIGFEDSYRGVIALQQTVAKPVLVNEWKTSEMEKLLLDKDTLHFKNFNEVMACTTL